MYQTASCFWCASAITIRHSFLLLVCVFIPLIRERIPSKNLLWISCFKIHGFLGDAHKKCGEFVAFNKFFAIRLFETRCTAVVIMSPKSMSFECIWFVRKCMTRYTYFVKKILILCFGQFVSWIISLIFEIFFLIRLYLYFITP